MPEIFKDSSYDKKGVFTGFLSQTNEKEITINYILKQLKEKYNLSKYNKFTFTDIGAGDGTLTIPIMQFIEKYTKLETYIIEPSSLMDILKKKCGKKAHYIQNGMEETQIPKSDFILIAHAIQYLKNRKQFAQDLKKSLNKNGKILVVGTHPDSPDLKIKKELKKDIRSIKPDMPKENLFEYLEEQGFKIKREFADAIIDLSNAQKLNSTGKEVISFFFHKPFNEISKQDIQNFLDISKKYAPDNKLTKKLQFIWVE